MRIPAESLVSIEGTGDLVRFAVVLAALAGLAALVSKLAGLGYSTAQLTAAGRAAIQLTIVGSLILNPPTLFCEAFAKCVRGGGLG